MYNLIIEKKIQTSSVIYFFNVLLKYVKNCCEIFRKFGEKKLQNTYRNILFEYLSEKSCLLTVALSSNHVKQ